MKKYTIKNYKGNLVESLKNFSKKYKGMRIVEAKQDGKMLKIKADLREDEETNESLYDYADEPYDENETGDPVGMRFSNIKELADALAEYVKSEKEMGWNYNFLHVRDVNSNEEVEVKKANVNGAVAYWGNGHLVISFGEK